VQAAVQTLESERAALEEQLAAAQVDLSCFGFPHCIITMFYIQFSYLMTLHLPLSMCDVDSSCAASQS